MSNPFELNKYLNHHGLRWKSSIFPEKCQDIDTKWQQGNLTAVKGIERENDKYDSDAIDSEGDDSSDVILAKFKGAEFQGKPRFIRIR